MDNLFCFKNLTKYALFFEEVCKIRAHKDPPVCNKVG